MSTTAAPPSDLPSPPLHRLSRRAHGVRHAGGFVFGALLLWQDVAGIATLIFASPERDLFLLLLFFGLFITFGSIGMAVGVMQLGEERPLRSAQRCTTMPSASMRHCQP